MHAQEINEVFAGLQNEVALSVFVHLLVHVCMVTRSLTLVRDGTVYFLLLFFCT